MRHRVMVTALFSGDNISSKSFYYAQAAGGKTLYCDALTPAEATCKYMLATTPIDEIVVIGSETTGMSEADSKPMYLREGSSFFTASLESLSHYDLLRYKLAEYLDDIHAEAQDIDDLLSDEEEKEITAFIRRFFAERLPDEVDKPSRHFHLLAQDKDLLEELNEALRGLASEADFERYRTWVQHHLYQTLKETFKMELLEANANVRIRCVPAKEGASYAFLKRIMAILTQADTPGESEGTDVYICLQNIDASVTMTVVNFTNLMRIIPDNQVRVCKIITTTSLPGLLAARISDDAEAQSISALFSGMDAFLTNGKAKGVVEYWKGVNGKNPNIDSVVYAMRNIDNGISLCDINDIERGIRSLREQLKHGNHLGGSTPREQLFEILLESTRKDYGRLLESDKIEFIELVRWAYRKEFWQQTLTLIESRAPQDFINRGFYFYCDSEEKRQQVIRIFGQIYYDLRPYEKYKLDKVSHYYIKYYSRQKASRQKHGREYIESYAKLRADELDNKNPDEIRACTVCPDRAAVEDLLFAYYYIGEVRNQTNHAVSTYDGFYSIMADSDSGERMEMIRQSIDYFLHCYDKVAQLSEGRPVHVIEITNEEVTNCADRLRQEYRNKER